MQPVKAELVASVTVGVKRGMGRVVIPVRQDPYTDVATLLRRPLAAGRLGVRTQPTLPQE